MTLYSIGQSIKSNSEYHYMKKCLQVYFYKLHVIPAKKGDKQKKYMYN